MNTETGEYDFRYPHGGAGGQSSARTNSAETPKSQTNQSSHRNREWGDQNTADYMDSLLKARPKRKVASWNSSNAAARPATFDEWRRIEREISTNVATFEDKKD